MVLGLKVCSSTEFSETMNSESMIPGIKLFGRKILAPERHFPADSHTTSALPTDSQTLNVYCGDSKAENPVKSLGARTSHQSREKGNVRSAKEDEEEEEEEEEEEKRLKKPDKILPCPRCNSLETKFCYFNNYNVNQPRHFCKNCQRYWTAGGTMRNVPIGAGRRKNKQFAASQYREACLFNGAPPASSNNIETSDTTNHHHVGDDVTTSSSEAKGTVLKFGPDTCVSESVESCSETTAVCYDNYNRPLLHHPLQHQQIPAAALFVPWNSNVGSFQWCSSSPMVAIPNVPLQLVAAGPCVGGAVPVSMPMPIYTSGPPVGNNSVSYGGHCFATKNGFSTLGKHPRDPNGGILESSCLLPKVPKIDGQSEVASNSVCTTRLGIGRAVICRSKGEFSGSDDSSRG